MTTSSDTIMSGAKALVTGGAGFIGSHLVEELVSRGANVDVVDNLSSGCVENLAEVTDRIGFFKDDLRQWISSGHADWNAYDFIFHLAANSYIPPSVENPEYDYETNLHATFLMLDALRKCGFKGRFAFASTGGVYGNPARLPISEDDPTVPISPYGVSKLAAERYAAVFAALYDIRVVSLRFFSVYGPRQGKQVAYDFLRKLADNPDELEIVGDGTQTRDLVFVDDLVRAVLLAVDKSPCKGEALNIASGRTYSIADIAREICSICELKPRINYTGRLRPGDAERWEVDITRLRALGFSANIPLRDGLSRVKKWFDDERKEPLAETQRGYSG